MYYFLIRKSMRWTFRLQNRLVDKIKIHIISMLWHILHCFSLLLTSYWYAISFPCCGISIWSEQQRKTMQVLDKKPACIYLVRKFTGGASLMFRTIVTTRSQGIQMNKYMRMLNFMFSPPGNSLRLFLLPFLITHGVIHAYSMVERWEYLWTVYIDFDVQLLSVLHNSDSWHLLCIVICQT